MASMTTAPATAILSPPSGGSSFPPPSTGKRKKAASRVFGEELFGDGTTTTATTATKPVSSTMMNDSSLCYSLSPSSSSTRSGRSGGKEREGEGGDVTTNNVSSKNDDTMLSSTSSIPEDDQLGVDSSNAEPTILFTANENSVDGKKQSVSSRSLSSVSSQVETEHAKSSKGSGVMSTKENNQNRSSRRDVSNNGTVSTKNPFASATGMQKIRDEELSRLRATKRSPLRQQMAKKTEEAFRIASANIGGSIGSATMPSSSFVDPGPHNTNTISHSRSRTETATTNLVRRKKNAVVAIKAGSANGASINSVLNSSRNAKSSIVREKTQAVKSVRFQWQRENSETRLLNEKVEENRRQIRAIQKKLSSAHFKEKARKDESQKFERLAKLEDEYVFKSNVYSDHQKRLKEERDQKRRQSTDARARVRQNKKLGSEKLRMMKIEEDQANFEVSADLHRARREVARTNAEARRKSFQFRAGDAKKIRTMRERWHEQDIQARHESFELTRAAAKDVENYNRRVQFEDQEDKRSRNLEARKYRQREEERQHDAMMAEHRSFELKWAGERDAEAYNKKLKEERRKSTERRNKESVRHAKVMEELQSLAKQKEAEDYMLKWGGEKDVKSYLSKMAEERRKSLQQRAADSRKAREIEEEEHAKAVQSSLEEMILQSECQKDIEKYKAECAERDRKSLQYRGKQLQLQHLEEEKQRIEQLRKKEESAELETLARKDVEEYYKDCQKRRRKSLAWRAKERRRNFEWKREKREADVRGRAHTSYLQSLDMKHMALAQEEERAKKAMDALRSAGCTFHGNPFLDLDM